MTSPVITNGAIVWSGGFSVDADGSPRAYHPSGEPGLDYLANAGKDGAWWGLACNPFGIPHVQGPGDPAPGFFVSTTSLVDGVYPVQDPRRYVNSEVVSYASVARDLTHRITQRTRVGDIGVAIREKIVAPFIVADIGPTGKYGEGSVALAKALGINSDPKRGGCESGVKWIIFPGSSAGWPRDFASDALARFATFSHAS